MAYTVEQQKRIDYFRKSVRLDSVTTANDPAYQFEDEDLYGILDISASAHNGSSIDEVSNAEFYPVLLLAKREIYFRLATTTAPFYPLSAEGASLQKNIRFDHYIKLVDTVMSEYEALMTRKDSGGDLDLGGGQSIVESYTTTLYKPNRYRNSYIQNTDIAPMELNVSGITETSVNLDWSKYISYHGSDFINYSIYVDTDIIYDEYSPNKRIMVKPLHTVRNINQTKLRVSDLTAGEKYYVLLKVETSTGLDVYTQVFFETLSDLPVKPIKAILIRDEEIL